MKTIPRIGIILIAVIAFPTLFLSVYEVSNLSNNQQVIDSIYSSQLDNLVASINDYSITAVSKWAEQLDSPILLDSVNRTKEIASFLNSRYAAQSIFLIKFDRNFSIFYSSDSVEPGIVDRNFLIEKLEASASEISKLESYLNNGYRKIIPIELSNNSTRLFIFALSNKTTQFSIGGVVVTSQAFIKESLGPKIQSIAQDKFIISVTKDDVEVYTNEMNAIGNREIRIKEPMWLFENFEVGIQLRNDPIEQMVKERTNVNIIMIVLMDLVLLVGAWFVYRSIRKEIQLAQIKAEFVSNVSHEIKTPLALINMYSETLEMGRVNAEEKKMEYYKVINKEAKRLARMVNKILNFSKIESGKRVYNFIETDVNEIVDQVVATYQHHFKNSGFDYEIIYGDNLPLIMGDEEAITDALTNLIDNGMKYSADTKKIVLCTGIQNNLVFVEVKDSGVGIKEKEQRLIFDKFYRVTDGNLASMAKGSGIGLNIVQNIVAAHKGTISVKSKFGEGSSFYMSFPHI